MSGAGSFHSARNRSRDLSLLEPAAPRTAGVGVVRIAPRPARPRMPRAYLLWFLAAGLAAAAIWLHHRAPGPATPPSVPTAEGRSGVLEQSIRLTGSTVAERSVLLRAPYLRGRRSAGVAGDFELVLEELAAPGSRVAKNDVVAAFERMYMRNRLDDYRAAEVDRELRLKTLRAQQDVKRAAYRQHILVVRARMDKAALDLKTAPVRSAIQATLFQLAFEEAKLAYEALLAQTRYVEARDNSELRLAELELREAGVELRRAEANVERMVVRTPVEGLVVITDIFRGAEFGRVQAGDRLRSNQPFAQVVDTRAMIVEAHANQIDVERLRTGARAHVHFDAYSGLEMPARVYSMGSLAKSRGSRSNYVAEVPVFLKFERADARVIPNLTVRAEVILQRDRSEGIVPQQAVFYGAEDGQPFAYVNTPSGWEKRELELGLANNIDVAVHSGLKPGEEVALSEPSTNGSGRVNLRM